MYSTQPHLSTQQENTFSTDTILTRGALPSGNYHQAQREPTPPLSPSPPPPLLPPPLTPLKGPTTITPTITTTTPQEKIIFTPSLNYLPLRQSSPDERSSFFPQSEVTMRTKPAPHLPLLPMTVTRQREPLHTESSVNTKRSSERPLAHAATATIGFNDTRPAHILKKVNKRSEEWVTWMRGMVGLGEWPGARLKPKKKSLSSSQQKENSINVPFDDPGDDDDDELIIDVDHEEEDSSSQEEESSMAASPKKNIKGKKFSRPRTNMKSFSDLMKIGCFTFIFTLMTLMGISLFVALSVDIRSYAVIHGFMRTFQSMDTMFFQGGPDNVITTTPSTVTGDNEQVFNHKINTKMKTEGGEEEGEEEEEEKERLKAPSFSSPSSRLYHIKKDLNVTHFIHHMLTKGEALNRGENVLQLDGVTMMDTPQGIVMQYNLQKYFYLDLVKALTEKSYFEYSCCCQTSLTYFCDTDQNNIFIKELEYRFSHIVTKENLSSLYPHNKRSNYGHQREYSPWNLFFYMNDALKYAPELQCYFKATLTQTPHVSSFSSLTQSPPINTKQLLYAHLESDGGSRQEHISLK